MAERLQFDPVAFPRRYTRPADIEIAAVFASQLAYGRVRAFGPVLERLFAEMDAGFSPTVGVADACEEGFGACQCERALDDIAEESRWAEQKGGFVHVHDSASKESVLSEPLGAEQQRPTAQPERRI